MDRSEALAGRQLIVNADDFGLSDGINEAVIDAHEHGILTTASLMVNESCAFSAVRLAKEYPRLGVGLHLTLTEGRCALTREEIPGLAGEDQRFAHGPVGAGMNYFFSKKLRSQIEAEMEEQFCRFHATGLTLDHVNGHLNLHLHPVVFDLLLKNEMRWKIPAVRITTDPMAIDFRISSGAWGYRLSHAAIFAWLCSRARRRLRRTRIRSVRHVFGLLRNGRVDTEYLKRLLAHLPSGNSELYSHPSVKEFAREHIALKCPEVRSLLNNQKIRLIRYQDLA